MSSSEKTYEPKQIDDVTLAFPARVVGTLLPDWKDIPDEFRDWRGNEWTKLVDQWFYGGIPKDKVPEVKEGLDSKTVWRHLKACMSSFEPKHEHKVAGVAYLMSKWLEPLEPPN